MSKTQHDSETLADGQQVFTACAFIWREENGVREVFLAKRANTKKFLPGVYELPGGHIDYGEDLSAGLAREIKEEFGMNIQLGDPFAVFTYINEIKKSHSIEVVYFAQFKSPLSDIELDPDDHSGYGWFAEHQLADLYSAQKNVNDAEYRAVRRGFALLESGVVETGRIESIAT